MKKTTLTLVALLAVTSLVGCNPTSAPTTEGPTSAPATDNSQKIQTAIESLKGKSHNVEILQDVAIYKPKDPSVCDIYSEYKFSLGYYYKGEERSYSTKTEMMYCDLDKQTGEPIENTIRHSSTDTNLYFKDEDGTAYAENISFQNEVTKHTQAFYDEDAGYYQPVVFDTEFKNPWDFITTRDIGVKEDGNLTLINEKADFLAECYGTVGLNFITDNTLELDDKGRIIGIDIVIDDLVTDNYTRTNTFTLDYTGHDTAVLQHRTPYTHENPKLQAALDSIKGVKNYTYAKEYTYSYGATQDLITGYFTEEEIYWRHHTEEGNEHPYTKGDDYDYKSILMEDGTYYGHEYILRGNTWDWGVIYVSGTSPYIIDTFEGNGPRFYEINASIFRQIDEFTYEIEPYFVRKSGAYFDYGFLGVNSAAMETNTNKCIIHLAEDYSLEKVESGFSFQGVEYPVNYYLSDIGTTEIPSWSDDQVVWDY